MKTIFELNYKTEDGQWHNLLYANIEDANKDLEKNYFIEAVVNDKIVENSYIINRILF